MESHRLFKSTRNRIVYSSRHGIVSCVFVDDTQAFTILISMKDGGVRNASDLTMKNLSFLTSVFFLFLQDQYVFVHDVLLEYIASGITEFSLMQISDYYRNLLAPCKKSAANHSPVTAPSNGGVVDEKSAAGDIGQPLLKNGLEKQFMVNRYFNA